jgi:hypothetical protein
VQLLDEHSIGGYVILIACTTIFDCLVDRRAFFRKDVRVWSAM